MKQLIVGYITIIMALLSLEDALSPISIGIYHLRPFLMPIALFSLAWIELHGREPGIKRKHHSHRAVIVCVIISAWFIFRACHHSAHAG